MTPEEAQEVITRYNRGEISFSTALSRLDGFDGSLPDFGSPPDSDADDGASVGPKTLMSKATSGRSRYLSVSGIGGRTGTIRVEGTQSAQLGRRDSPDETVGMRVNLPTEPGEYRLVIGGEVTDRLTITPSEAGTTANMGYGWNGTIKRVNWERGTSETTQEEYDPDGPDQPDAANIPGLVTGDEGGLVLAPSLRRQGYSADRLGGEITIGGETYQINPADTVVRDPETGEAVDRGPGGESGAPGENPSQRGASGLGDAGMALGALALVGAGWVMTR